MTLTQGGGGLAAPRVTVFGGSGFIGSRVCKALCMAGAAVTSVSRGGIPAQLLEGGGAPPPSPPPWAEKVRWLRADVNTVEGAALALEAAGGAEAVVSCVGNVLPAGDWEQFWGLHWDDVTLRDENGAANERIVAAAAAAGTARFVYLTVAADVAEAYEGALEGYIDGKRMGEAAAEEAFGAGAVLVGPTLVYPSDGGLLGGLGSVAEAVLRTPLVKGFLAVNRAVGSLGWTGEDLVTKVALTEPVPVDSVAATVAAAALGAGTFSSGSGSGSGSSGASGNATRVDGSAGIRAVAADPQTVGPEALAVAAAVLGGETGAGGGGKRLVIDEGEEADEAKVSAAKEAKEANEAAAAATVASVVERRTWKPLAFPIAPTLAVLAVIAAVQSTIPPVVDVVESSSSSSPAAAAVAPIAVRSGGRRGV